jgi:lipoprotein-anchoring transpeptidase ErfK/SrfK
MLLVILMILSGFAIAWGYYQLGERIYPGIVVGNLDLSGMTKDEAARMLDKTWNLEHMILVTNGIENQLLQPAQLGLSLDASRTAKNAYEIGRNGSIMARLAQIYASWKDGWQIQPEIAFDEDGARTGLSELAPAMSRPPVDASIRVQGTDLIAVPSELGYTINIEETLAALRSDPSLVLQTGLLPAVPQPVPPAVTDVTPVLANAEEILDRPALVSVYDPISNETMAFTIPPERVASWLRVSFADHGLQVDLDEAGASAYLSELSGQLGPGRSIEASQQGTGLATALRSGSAFVIAARHPTTTYIVQSGDTLLKLGWRMGIPYWMILKANPGINPDELVAGEELVIPSKDDLLPLPIVPNKRIVINLNRQRLLVFQDGAQIAQHVISTGIDRSPTQPGVFQVQTHEKSAYASVWDLYMPNFLGIYEAWPGFMNGIHGLPTLSNGQRMWANSLGRPASYGCIILGLEEAQWLYSWAEDGVIVEVRE